jgi:YHS domain-containing protein
MRLITLIIATATLLLSVAGSTMAAERINTLEKKTFFGYEANGIAIRGYDTVAYFTQSKPVEGSDEFTTEWSGATWKFSSQEHLDLFVADPEKYAPQYGGYCAYGVAQNYLVKIEPDQWTIHNDKLYLNYDRKVNKDWKTDIEGYVKQADALFESLLAKP